MTITISGTTGIAGVDGSAATPSVQGADTNTGMFFPAADTIAFAEGGTEVMRIDSSGNVGIGTTTPSYKLDVSGSIRGAAGSTSFLTTDAGDLTLNATNAAGQIALRVAGSEAMRIDTSGVITGTAGNVMLISGASVASTSGTSIDFTGIPSWVKRVTVIFRGVSITGTSPPQIQLGTAGGIVSSGYVCGNSLVAQAALSVNFTAAFGIGINTSNWLASHLASGQVIFSLIGSNTWAGSGAITASGIPSTYFTTGSVALGNTLDRVRITTAGGANTFDAGTINIMYE